MLNLFRFTISSFCITLCACANVEEHKSLYILSDTKNKMQFSGDVTLEIFSFVQDEKTNCQTLLSTNGWPAGVEPLAREKADATNRGGEAAFLLERFIPDQNHVIVVRALNLTTGVVYAFACEENLITKAGEKKEIHLYLTPTKTHDADN